MTARYFRVATGAGAAWAREDGAALRLLAGEPFAGATETGATLEGCVGGRVRQRSSTDQLIFPADYLVWYVSRVMTLLPGDIISTGTPAGIGPLAAGEEVDVEGVGVLRNPVL